MPPMSHLAGKHIVLGLSGGIAAYKSAELCRALVKAGATVQVVMTEAAEHFMTAVTMQALSGRPVYTSQWDAREANNMAHINLSREADAIVVAPASADFMAKLLHGRADELLSLMCLARPIEQVPLIVAPAMNREMWANPATRRNVAQLQADGIHVLDVGQGEQACGETGDGRMLEAGEILEDLEVFFAPKAMQGLQVLVTAGPTYEAIDPVRGITNLSSGKMGFSIARAARLAGADVTLVAGPVSLPTPRGVRRVDVRSARDMLQAVEKALPADCAIFCAAVADWRVAHEGDQKFKKEAGGLPPLSLTENPDILATVSRMGDKRPELVVGFAAETEKVIAHAQAKLARKGCDWIVANDVSHEGGVMGGDMNTVHLVTKTGVEDWPKMGKDAVAEKLVARIAATLKGRWV